MVWRNARRNPDKDHDEQPAVGKTSDGQEESFIVRCR